ncbi:alkyl sulfatase dimerization domain-containing protein [Pseudomonas baetica]|uniref:alkyl sulfatase dimerization domain-containing protein n=1 Tax=Pseudomonas baetica TaxID=674054 RepID=UPI002405BCDD|nr:alkyl sulfatase dimerization domain-containing protein [Pseudomonas baetica]MDF9773911.1 alkyl sulfatase BDS1-like metallo-beta-lactamase superfamily hydrolase [Pseudomonas baetica]
MEIRGPRIAALNVFCPSLLIALADLGGEAAVLGKMQAAMAKGEYRRAAQPGNQLLLANPDNADGRKGETTSRRYQANGYVLKPKT